MATCCSSFLRGVAQLLKGRSCAGTCGLHLLKQCVYSERKSHEEGSHDHVQKHIIDSYIHVIY